MCTLGPGSLVECVESFSGGGFAITARRIYVATEVQPHWRLSGPCTHGPQCKADGLKLRESPTPPGVYWCAAAFRPVGEPASDLIAQIHVSQWLGELAA
jgi:hypothetical protein